MSEQINNRQYRQNVIKELIRELHEGKTVDEVNTSLNRHLQELGYRNIGSGTGINQ